MARSTKAQMVAGAASLLAERGLADTSFSQVLAATGAPRGSIYHHFPGGKDELVTAGVEWAGQLLLDALAQQEPTSAEAVARGFARPFRRLLTERRPAAGCAVAAVVIDAPVGSPAKEAAAGVLKAWRQALSARYVAAGVDAGRADALAAATVAAVEGALVLARAEGDARVFDDVVDQLVAGLPAAFPDVD